MINFLSSNLIALAELPSFSRRKSRDRFATLGGREAPCPADLYRSIGRWENEGGAVLRESATSNAFLKVNPTKESKTVRRAKIMKPTNQHEDMVRYGDPAMVRSRRGRGGYSVMTYNDRSSETRAMNAYLRASSYPEQRDGKRFRSRSHLTNTKTRSKKRLHPFLHLSQRYDAPARDNFIREGIVFVLLVAAAAWPIIHSVQAIIAMW